MGEGKLTPLNTPTALNRQSRNIAHVIKSTISPHKPHLAKIAPGVNSPHIAKVTTQFFYFFFVRKNLSTDLEIRPLNRFCYAILSTDAYSHRVVPFGGQKTIISHLHLQNPQKPNFRAHIMVSLWEMYILITAWYIKIRCWNLARCLTLPSTLSTRKSFSVWQGASSPTLNFCTPSLSGKLIHL